MLNDYDGDYKPLALWKESIATIVAQYQQKTPVQRWFMKFWQDIVMSKWARPAIAVASVFLFSLAMAVILSNTPREIAFVVGVLIGASLAVLLYILIRTS